MNDYKWWQTLDILYELEEEYNDCLNNVTLISEKYFKFVTLYNNLNVTDNEYNYFMEILSDNYIEIYNSTYYIGSNLSELIKSTIYYTQNIVVFFLSKEFTDIYCSFKRDIVIEIVNKLKDVIDDTLILNEMLFGIYLGFISMFPNDIFVYDLINIMDIEFYLKKYDEIKNKNDNIQMKKLFLENDEKYFLPIRDLFIF